MIMMLLISKMMMMIIDDGDNGKDYNDDGNVTNIWQYQNGNVINICAAGNIFVQFSGQTLATVFHVLHIFHIQQ